MEKTIFLSGAVSNDKHYKTKFYMLKFKVRDYYGDEEVHIIAPSDLDMTGLSYESCMQITLEIIKYCDTVVFAKDWKESKGAQVEHEFAVRLNKKIIYEDSLEKSEEE